MSHIRHYRVLQWPTRPLTLLESIAKVSDQQVAKTGKSSIFWLLSFLQHNSTTMAEGITTIQTRKKSTNHWVLYSLLIVIVELELFCSDSQALQCCYCHKNTIVHRNYAPGSLTEHVFRYSLYCDKMKTATAKVRWCNTKRREGMCAYLEKYIYC